MSACARGSRAPPSLASRPSSRLNQYPARSYLITVPVGGTAWLPVVYPFREAVEDGGLMALSTDLQEVGRRGASYVDKILKGTKPADLPVEQPTKFELVINLKTAK